MSRMKSSAKITKTTATLKELMKNGGVSEQ